MRSCFLKAGAVDAMVAVAPRRRAAVLLDDDAVHREKHARVADATVDVLQLKQKQTCSAEAELSMLARMIEALLLLQSSRTTAAGVAAIGVSRASDSARVVSIIRARVPSWSVAGCARILEWPL